MSDTSKKTAPMAWVSLALFVIVTMGLGATAGILTPPGEWYANLNQPSFTPPNWLFGPVWTVLYAMVGIAGWRTRQRRYHGIAMQVWFGQLAVNLTWSPVFFGLHLIGLALLIIAVMVLLTIVFIRLTWHTDRIAAYLMLPYLAWISFASILNAAFWVLN